MPEHGDPSKRQETGSAPAQTPQNKAEEGESLGTGNPKHGKKGLVPEHRQPLTRQKRASA